MPSFAGARAKLATATQDLFRLSGNYSIPVEAPPPAPAPTPPPADTAPRSSEASIMFSLESLMKANGGSVAPKRDEPDQASEQLWNMQAVTPLFGTANDQALLTTPLKLDPTPSMDSMTLPSHAPSARRWPLLAALGAGLALAVGGIWMFAPSSADPELAPAPTANEPAPGEPRASEPAAANDAPPEGAAPGAEPASAARSDDAPGEPGEAPEGTPPEGTPPAATAEPSDTPPAAEAQAAPTPKPEAPKPEARRTAPRKPPSRAPSSRASAPFNTNAARSALGAAASAAAQCGQGGAPGKGKVQVTFAPSGKVSGAQLVQGPFGGTAAGKCALRYFRAAKVPAFSGPAVTVAKSFKIE